MKKIVITEFMNQSAVADLAKDFEVFYDPQCVDHPDILHKQIETADGLIVRNRTQVKGKILAQAQQLKVVGRLGVGLDNIDLETCQQRGIQVFPASGANDIAVAEYVLTSILLLFRQSYHSSLEVAQGKWPRTELMGREIYRKKLGLIGYGSIARELAQRAKALGMEIGAYDPYLPATHPAWQNVDSLSVADLYAWADVISLHVPLTEETRHLIDANSLQQMQDGVFIINAARGGVVDEDALANALQSGKVGGAALDVFEREPLDAKAGKRFENLTNVILTPHIAGVTVESNIRVSAMIAEQVRKALENK